jgi:hypothetical protein
MKLLTLLSSLTERGQTDKTMAPQNLFLSPSPYADMAWAPVKHGNEPSCSTNQ